MKYRVGLALMVVLLLSLSSAVVLAATVFVVNSEDCPANWIQGTGYECTVDVTSITPPDGKVCLTYSETGGAGGTVPCTGSTPGTWTCLIPEFPSTTITWEFAGWTSANSSCGDLKTQGPTGSFQTTATAVTLQGLRAYATPIASVVAVIAAVALLGGGMLFLVQRRR